MKLHFLKTKWSDIIILTDGRHTALIDTGFDEQYPQLSSYLDKLGVTDISFILLTHFHRDHYGNIEALIDNYKVEKVYLKEYSGLDSTTAWGTEADDEYRNSEKEKYTAVRSRIKEKSTLIQVENVSEIEFGEYTLKLLMTENTIQKIYNDASYPETYHRITFSENQNSLAVFTEADGKKILLGGDVLDLASSHPLADYVNLKIAKNIGCEIDIYKAAHHGTYNTGCAETLGILKPKTVIITNEDAYLSENSDIYGKLKAANPNVKILLTENENVVIDTKEKKHGTD